MSGKLTADYFIKLGVPNEKMKTFLLVLTTLACSLAYGHDYYFAFAEVEYNDFSQKFEATLIASGHDMEHFLSDVGLDIDKVSSLTPETTEFATLQKVINRHFSISSKGEKVHFQLLGSEVLLNGTVQFYLESNPIIVSSSIQVRFDLLMDRYEQQQNKITLFYRSKSHTATFLKGQKQQEIVIENR